jgi:hypothetical protein
MKKNLRKLFVILTLPLLIIFIIQADKKNLFINVVAADRVRITTSQSLIGQVVSDPDNPEWFKYYGGGPMFMCGPGDPENFLYRGTRNADGTRSGDQMTLINKLKGTGANSVYLQIIRSHGGDADHNPFNDYTDPSSGLDSDILAQWETWFTELDNDGINILLFFYDDAINVSNNLGWSMSAGELHSDEQAFIQGIVNTFEHHKHLIWCVMEEVEEMGSDYLAHASKIAETIKAADDYDHPVACHQLSGLVCDFPDDPNMDQFAIQYNTGTATNLHNGMLTAWNNSAGRYNLNLAEANGHYNPGSTSRADLRKKNWAIAMGGAYVMVFRMDIASTSIDELEDCGRLVQFFEMTNFNVMAPRDDLAHGGTDYTLALPGDSYIAYAANLSSDIGIKSMTASTYKFVWYDCETGTTVTENYKSVSSGDLTWTKPTELSGNEVAVWITDVSGVDFYGRVFMEGPYSDGSMNTTLRDSSDLPLSHPFGGPPYSHEGTESVSSIPAGVVDWILVELRTQSGSSSKVASRAAFIKSDGMIVDLDGISQVTLSGMTPGNYYVVVKHRNHIEIMSTNSITLTSSSSSLYDFTTDSSRFYGTAGAKEIDTDVWGMWSGDISQDCEVTTEDYTSWYNSARTGESGYQTTDINLDGEVTTLDYTIWYNNARAGASSGVP